MATDSTSNANLDEIETGYTHTSTTSPPTDQDSLLESLEIATGHVQRGQVADQAGLEEAVQSIPDHLRVTEDAPTPCAFITGRAGTGKTFTVRERCAADPMYAVLAASTGIAAVNLSTVTIHSTLGFFDTDSMRDAYIHGSAQAKLRKLAQEGYRNLVLDECSMVSHEQLDLLVHIFDNVNERLEMEGDSPIGLILVGDFAQLPAIAERKDDGYQKGKRRPAAPIPWAFESQFWGRFEKNITRLTKVWRQADSRFLAALDFARAGRGRDVVQVLQSCGQRFEQYVDNDFDGTTIVGKNDEVDRHNILRLGRVKGRAIQLPARRWAAGGKVRPEWKNVPERVMIRENAYVMILSNKYDGRDLVYANGDCGWVRGIQPSVDNLCPPSVLVELVRTGEVVQVESLVRNIDHAEKPDWYGGGWSEASEEKRYLSEPHARTIRNRKRFVTGQIEYYPLRVAYASTVHKAQGLSLDRVQIDFRGWMFKQMHAMSYVSLSRARTLEGLRLVGMPEMLAERCKVDAKVARWL